MTNLQFWEDKMKEKRKKTPWIDFVKEICSWRALTFYKANGLISRYPPTSRIWKVISSKNFNLERDSLLTYWKDYDFNKKFFTNFQDLFLSVPLENMLLFSGCENSEFSDQSMNSKNSYLSFVVAWWENIFYSMVIKDNSYNVLNSISVIWSENIYFGYNIVTSHKIFYSKHIENSSEIRFCTNLIWCHECLFCNWLENSSYCIKNEKYSLEEYKKEKQKILKNKNTFLNSFLALPWANKSFSSTNVIWQYLTNCSDIKGWYYLHNVHKSKNVISVSGWDWCTWLYDTFMATGFPTAKDYYWIMWCAWWNNVYNSYIIPLCSSVYYCFGLENCSFCLWCIWLRNKSYCILNKQYSKEEWHELTNKIFAQMESDWILWNFFPWDLNPFYFNDTVAYLLDNTFTKEEIIADWYLWRDDEIKVDIPEWVNVVNIKDLDIVNFDESILKKVIVDNNWNYYKIVKMEYDFLKKHNLPLPEIHWLDRIKLWFKF